MRIQRVERATLGVTYCPRVRRAQIKKALHDMNTYAEHCPHGSLSPTILLII
jgi:hypothetical protein